MEETKLKRCPFCGGGFKLIPLDDEFNIHTEDGYEKNPWSGIQYGIMHEVSENPNCPIATHNGELLGIYGYDTKEEAINALNTRKSIQKIVEQLEESSDYYDCIVPREGNYVKLNDAIKIIEKEGELYDNV